MFKDRWKLQGLYFRQAPNDIRSADLYTEATLSFTDGGYVKKGGSLASPVDLNLHINISEIKCLKP